MYDNFTGSYEVLRLNATGHIDPSLQHQTSNLITFVRAIKEELFVMTEDGILERLSLLNYTLLETFNTTVTQVYDTCQIKVSLKYILTRFFSFEDSNSNRIFTYVCINSLYIISRRMS